MLESSGFEDDYKPTQQILQEGLGNGGANSGMGIYAHCHDALFAFKALFRQGIIGKGYYPGLAVPVCLLVALCASGF